MTRAEMGDWYGWDELDVLLVSGDAYVDHPAFGIAIIARVLAAEGLRVGVVAQPQQAEDLLAMGRPRLCVGISAGTLDSLINHYTPSGKRRREDRYSPGGQPRRRPDRATIAYSSMCRQVFPGLALIIGGIEASLRRFIHFDCLQQTLRRSLLADSKADLLVYGMAEQTIVTIARHLAAGHDLGCLPPTPGTCRRLGRDESATAALDLPGWDSIQGDRQRFAEAAEIIRRHQDPYRGRPLVQDQGWCRIVQQPPALPLDTAALDAVYALPFTRREHPAHSALGVPALATVRWSMTAHRGCAGSCAFCAISAHQGRIVSSRSPASLVAEAQRLSTDPGFTGTIDDVGGPTANMYGYSCPRWHTGQGACADRDCLWPTPCPQLRGNGQALVELLNAIAALPTVRHVFVQSGLRHDLLLRDPDPVLQALLGRHCPGRLKFAPEHADDRVLHLMRKPAWQVCLDFLARCRRLPGRSPPLIPYLIAGHPGDSRASGASAATRLGAARLNTDLIQAFTPSPGTEATAMHVSGVDPRSGQAVDICDPATSGTIKRTMNRQRPGSGRKP